MSVTRFGVSLLNVVATIERPASHQGTARPPAKNSVVLLPARRPKKSAGAKQSRTQKIAMLQSRRVRCMGGGTIPSIRVGGDRGRVQGGVQGGRVGTWNRRRSVIVSYYASYSVCYTLCVTSSPRPK